MERSASSSIFQHPTAVSSPSNSLIPSEDFFLHYATINHAIALIKLARKGSWFSKNIHHQCFQSPPNSPRLLPFLRSPLVWCILLHLEAHLWLQSSLNSSTPYLKPSAGSCQQPWDSVPCPSLKQFLIICPPHRHPHPAWLP